jgi:signal transduction histidine kinase
MEVTRIFRSVSTARAVAIVRSDEQGPYIAATEGPEAGQLEQVVSGLSLGDTAEAVSLVTVDGTDRWAVLLSVRSALSSSAALLGIFDSDGPLRDPQEQQLMRSFADHVGLALDRASALEDRAELAILSDRDRIARDLHDLVIQRLFATGMRLQGLQMLAERPEFIDGIDRAVDDIDKTIKDIRGSIFQLQSRKNASLRGDVRKLAQEYEPTLGFAPSVRTSGPVDTAVPDEVQVELLAVIREALANIAKHARASSASVELDVTSQMLILRVTDDGVGLPADRHESGLRNARDRATAREGSFNLAPNEPSGTLFIWRVPIG